MLKWISYLEKYAVFQHFPWVLFSLLFFIVIFICTNKVLLRVKVVFDEHSHSARRGVDRMFWSSELLKVLGNCFLQRKDQSMIAHFKGGKHWIAILYKIKAGRTLAAYIKRRVSHMLNDALAFLFQECILDTASEAYTVGKNAQTCDRKVADSDPWKLLQCCRDWSVLWAQWLRCLPEVPAAEMKHKSEPESVSTQTTEKMLTRLVLVTHSSCSANYCSTHPSENHVRSSKALGVVILCQLKYTGCYRESRAVTHSYRGSFSSSGPLPDHSLSALCPLLTLSERWCWCQHAAEHTAPALWT